MCDRILVFSSNPGRVASELRVPFTHPRNRHDEAFRQLVDDIYALMTKRAPTPAVVARPAGAPPQIGMVLHPLSTNIIAGLLETLAGEPYHGRADLPALASALQLELDDLLPLGEVLGLLRLADLAEGDLQITPKGREFVQADTEERKKMFAAALTANVPLIALIHREVAERRNHRVSASRFRDDLEEFMSPDYAEETLLAAIAWGRYAELFSYDEDADQFYLEEDE
jgi:NitT/TauT family transport system ATP-binding protein